MEYKLEQINNWKSLRKDGNITYVILTHLFVEHGLDYLIFLKCKNSKNILNDNRTYTFSVKLNLCFELEFISEKCYKYINVLNKLRNKMAHKLDIDYDSFKNSITSILGDELFLSAEFMGIDNKNEKLKYLIMDLGNNTIIPLNELIKEKYLVKK